MLRIASGKVTCFFIFIFLLQAFNGIGQLSKVDSLSMLLKQQDLTGTERYKILADLSYTLCRSDIKLARRYAYEAKNVAKQLKSDQLYGRALSLVGLTYKAEGAYEKALLNYRQAYDLETEPINRGNILGRIGSIYSHLAKYDSAFHYYNAALAIRQEIGDEEGVSFSYNNLGTLYERKGEYKKAIEYYFKDLRLSEKLGVSDQDRGVTLYNIGLVYSTLEDHKLSLKYLNQSLELRKKVGDKKGMAVTLSALGDLYLNIENYSLSFDHYTEALQLCRDLGDVRREAEVLADLGYWHHKRKIYQKATELFREALALYQQINDKRGLLECYKSLSETLYKQKDYVAASKLVSKAYPLAEEMGAKSVILELMELENKVVLSSVNQFKALEQVQRFLNLKDSIYNLEKAKQIAELQAEYDLSNTEKENALLRKEQDLQQIRLKQEHNATLTFGGISFILTLLAIFFYRQRRYGLKVNKVLQTKNKELKERETELIEHSEELSQVNEELLASNNALQEAYGRIELKNEQITQSINYACRIQEALFPTKEDINQNFKGSFVYFKPLDLISGDFYWLLNFEGLVFWAAVDCTGHGVPGALMSMLASSGLDDIVRNDRVTDPARILEYLHLRIVDTLKQQQGYNNDGMDVSLCVYDPVSKKLSFSGARHSICYIQNGELNMIKGVKRSIGGEMFHKPFKSHEISIKVPTQVYLYSDGYKDQFGGPKNKRFMAHRFRNLLEEIHHHDMGKQYELLDRNFYGWMNESRTTQVDDVLVWGVLID
ncbi:tetratricopeptide repeat protein [Limibacter armeniacum]|uniref:tetratricopeptide repeat protein n=1 Tax=Limibacter armeniacum TaxID=466084 RepID=UPI002FE5AE02